MPEQPFSKFHVPKQVRNLIPEKAPSVRYVELHCKTNFSFLEGASHPDELVAQAAGLGYAGMAVTDRNSLAGAVRAHVAAKEAGIKLLIGAEITLVDASPVVVWVMNRAGYGRLCRLLTRGRRQAKKGECRLAFADVAEHASGLLLGALLQHSGEGSSDLHRWREVFSDRAYAVAELHRGPCDGRRFSRWQRAALEARLPIVAAGDVHYHDAQRRYLQDVLSAIRLKKTVAELGPDRFPNSERRMRSVEEIIGIYSQDNAAVRSAPPKSRTAAISPSTNCDMNTPRNYAPRMTHRTLTSHVSPGPGRQIDTPMVSRPR